MGWRREGLIVVRGVAGDCAGSSSSGPYPGRLMGTIFLGRFASGGAGAGEVEVVVGVDSLGDGAGAGLRARRLDEGDVVVRTCAGEARVGVARGLNEPR